MILLIRNQVNAENLCLNYNISISMREVLIPDSFIPEQLGFKLYKLIWRMHNLNELNKGY